MTDRKNPMTWDLAVVLALRAKEFGIFFIFHGIGLGPCHIRVWACFLTDFGDVLTCGPYRDILKCSI